MTDFDPDSFDGVETTDSTSDPIELYLFYDSSVSPTYYPYTSSDMPWTKTISSVSHVFEPCYIERGEIDYSSEGEGGKVDVSVASTHVVAQMFATSILATSMYLGIYQMHRSDFSLVCGFSGYVSGVTMEGHRATLHCLPFTALMSHRIPKITYQPVCNWPVYSTQCGLTASGRSCAIAAMGDGNTRINSSDFWTTGQAEDYWLGGYMEWTGGKSFIIDCPSTGYNHFNVTVMTPLPAGTSTVTIYRGCGHTIADCRARSNAVHFSGFDQAPIVNPFVRV